VAGLAANDHAQRHISVVAPARFGEGDGPGNFQRAVDGDGLVRKTVRVEHGAGAAPEFVKQGVIEAGLDDQHRAVEALRAAFGWAGSGLLHRACASRSRAT